MGIKLPVIFFDAKNDYLNDIASGNANDRFYEMTLEQFILFGYPSLTLK